MQTADALTRQILHDPCRKHLKASAGSINPLLYSLSLSSLSLARFSTSSRSRSRSLLVSRLSTSRVVRVRVSLSPLPATDLASRPCSSALESARSSTRCVRRRNRPSSIACSAVTQNGAATAAASATSQSGADTMEGMSDKRHVGYATARMTAPPDSPRLPCHVAFRLAGSERPGSDGRPVTRKASQKGRSARETPRPLQHGA